MDACHRLGNHLHGIVIMSRPPAPFRDVNALGGHPLFLVRAAEIPIHPDPVHFTASDDLLLTDHRDVVFRLTCDRARVATEATVEVDRHPPLVVLIHREAPLQRRTGLLLIRPEIVWTFVERKIRRNMPVDTLILGEILGIVPMTIGHEGRVGL